MVSYDEYSDHFKEIVNLSSGRRMALQLAAKDVFSNQKFISLFTMYVVELF